MIEPDFETFRELARSANVVPVSRELLADGETPVSAFRKIHRGGPGFLLESVVGGERWGRYSFLGTEPDRVWTFRDRRLHEKRRTGEESTVDVADTMGALRDRLAPYVPAVLPGLPRFTGGAVGYFAWDLVREFEKLPKTAVNDLETPDAVIQLADRVVVFDNVTQRLRVLANAFVEPDADLREVYDRAIEGISEWVERLREPVADGGPLEVGAPARIDVHANMSPERYQAMVEAAKEYVRAGDVIQVVLAQRFDAPLRASAFDVYRWLRTINPSPYLFFLDMGDHALAGASPEVMARVEDGTVTVRPIAGTRPRGTAERSDESLEKELLADPKEVAEHVMLLDLGRNDVGRVSAIGGVEVTEEMVIERYSHVMHIVSNVQGKLAPGRDAFDAFRSTFPAGTLSGAPKIRAMEIIDELEPVGRGPYGGAVGYFGFSGNMDTGITIRTALVKDGRVYIQAGAGIVADSVPESEHVECVNKARGVLEAVRMASS